MNRYDETYAQVREIENNLHQRKAAIAALADASTRTEIPGGFGAVTADGNGKIRAIELVPHVGRVANARALGAALVAAIHQAERAAAEHRATL